MQGTAEQILVPHPQPVLFLGDMKLRKGHDWAPGPRLGSRPSSQILNFQNRIQWGLTNPHILAVLALGRVVGMGVGRSS